MFESTDEIKSAEARLFIALAEQSSEVIILTNRKGLILYHNAALEKYLGLKQEDLTGSEWHSLVHPDELSRVTEAIEQLFMNVSAPVRKTEIRLRHQDGDWRSFQAAAGHFVNNNVVEAAIINLQDVTARRQAEKTLRKIEKRYRLLAEHMKDQLWIMDLNLNLSYATPSVERMLGYTFDELKNITLNKLLTAGSFAKATDFYSREMSIALAASAGNLLKHPLELEFRAKDGRAIWGECMFSFIRNDDGSPMAILGEGRDITERKQMEDALRKSEENFHRSLDESPLGVRIATPEGMTLYANKTFLDIYGYGSVEELEKIPMQNRYTRESYAEYQSRKAIRMKGGFGPAEYEVSIIRKNGEIRHLHVFRKEIFWNGKKQYQVIYQDITLRRQAEEKLNHVLENLRHSIRITTQVLSLASEAKDPYMAGHQKRVTDLARAIATEMELPHDKIESIRIAGSIHDIGKISIPAEILCKPSMLSNLEFSLIKGHARSGYEIIKEVETPWPLADIILQHHERLDGSGYPQGLKDDDILMEARIIAVADVVESMISHRPYRPALGLDIALHEIENHAGTLYDCKASEACLNLFRKKGYNLVSA